MKVSGVVGCVWDGVKDGGCDVGEFCGGDDDGWRMNDGGV